MPGADRLRELHSAVSKNPSRVEARAFQRMIEKLEGNASIDLDCVAKIVGEALSKQLRVTEGARAQFNRNLRAIAQRRDRVKRNLLSSIRECERFIEENSAPGVVARDRANPLSALSLLSEALTNHPLFTEPAPASQPAHRPRKDWLTDTRSALRKAAVPSRLTEEVLRSFGLVAGRKTK